MKVANTTTCPDVSYKPFKITLTIESQAEARALMGIFNSRRVISATKDVINCTAIREMLRASEPYSSEGEPFYALIDEVDG